MLEAALPHVSRLAGRDAVEALAARLDDAHPHRAMARLLPVLTSELLEEEALAAALREALAFGRSSHNERAAVVEALSQLGARGLAEDLSATGRHLDADAIEDRLLMRGHRVRQQWEFGALALATAPLDELTEDEVVACRDAATSVARGTHRLWVVRAAACRLASAMCAAGGPGVSGARQALLELAHSTGDDPWVQVAALEGYLALCRNDRVVEQLLRALALPPARQRRHLPADHVFVRARIAALAGWRGAWGLLRELHAAAEPSPYVRAEVVRALGRSPHAVDHRVLTELVGDEDVPREVRGHAVVGCLPELLEDEAPGARWVDRVAAGLGAGRWVAALTARAVLDRLRVTRPSAALAAECLERWGPALQRCGGRGGDLAEHADALRLWLDCLADARLRPALVELLAWVARTSDGDSARFTVGPVAELAPEELLDVLSLAAQDGMDLAAAPRSGSLDARVPPARGYRVHHGWPERAAAWRIAYELRRPRPDKRQAHTHVVDRVPPAPLIAPSNRMSEVTPTAVVGKRGASPVRLRWGAHLPLPSMLLAGARRGGARVRTPSEAYALRPQGPGARWRLHRSYPRLAELRTQLVASGGDSGPYDEAAARAGVQIQRTWLPLLALEELWGPLVAMDSNSVPQLALFSAATLGAWVARARLQRREVEALRGRVNLVLGGWGSRGKSGTERLKAALLHGAGFSVLSKTTGCEAMVVSSIPGGTPTEVFLYRPYDKASIVEQRDVLRLAAGLGHQVLLWECMALNPYYVEILQRDWMRDDVSTITNTYPDHEDIQGPTGRDVAEVIARFIPEQGTLLTSEQHMTPVLEQQARRLGTAVQVVRPESWLLLPADLLARFPYAEHPRNIALVLDLAAALGIPRDQALRAMADHVVPDLGVLKEYGPVQTEGRTVSFVNGMSANERAGFLSNWERMELGAFGPEAGLGTWTVVLVNNRADRLARQAVFARIAALDVAADAIAVIGTNVQSFSDAWRVELRTALGAALSRIGNRDALVAELSRVLRRVPLPRDRAEAVLAEHPQAGEAGRRWVREVTWLHDLRVGSGPLDDAVQTALGWLEARLLPLVDPGLTGDQVLDAVLRGSPPGARVRILGSCNIKGTGLDFVYRWLSIQRVLGVAQQLADADADDVATALRTLATGAGLGVVDSEHALEAVEAGLQSGRFGVLNLDVDARVTADRLRSLAHSERSALLVHARRGPLQAVGRWVRGGLDFVDSVARRREADVLLRDLTTRRIGRERAAYVAKALVDRGKEPGVRS